MLELLVGLFDLWASLKLHDLLKADAQNQELDPPALRSFALVDLQPSGPWPALDDGVLRASAQRFDGLLAYLSEFGIEADPRITEDWGELGVAGPYRLGFSSLANRKGWLLFVERSGRRPLEDSPSTRQLLTAIDQGLRRMTGVTTVLWYKREQFKRGITADSAARPFAA